MAALVEKGLVEGLAVAVDSFALFVGLLLLGLVLLIRTPSGAAMERARR